MNKKLPIIHAIYCDRGFVIAGDGETVPITNWFCGAEQESEYSEDCTACVAGPMKDGGWLAIQLSKFEIVLQ